MPSNIISVEIKWTVILFLAKTVLTVSIQILSRVASSNSGYCRLHGDEEGGGKCWGQDALQVKQNGAFTWPHFGKMDRLLPFLYVTPTVSSATLLFLFEPISKMALP